VRLQDRVVVVTGVSRHAGIGAGVARRLGAEGAQVFLQSWSAHDAEQPWGADAGGPEALLVELRDSGVRAEHLSLDFAEPDAPAALIEAARSTFGHVDAVVANHARSSSQSLETLTSNEIDLSYAVNVRATLLQPRRAPRTAGDHGQLHRPRPQ
jgi:3-oxoacyl-[acyl-carrier protein] reductase